METMAQSLVLAFDTKTGKFSVDGGVSVYFKGFTTEEKFNEVAARQKEKDRADPPPPAPGDRDGYFVCKLATGAARKTWHVCSTVPPYTCTNLGSTCA